MKTLLHITCSLFEEQGKSTMLSSQLVDRLKEKHPGLSVVNRQLTPASMPYLDSELFGAFVTPAEERSDEQKGALAFSDELIAELRGVDAVIIGLPMYNLNVPAVFKSYIDHVVRVGETFRYTETGPQGLLDDRPVYVVTARGGYYAGNPMDTQTPYIQNILGLIGLRSVEFYHGEGLNISPEAADEAIQAVKARFLEDF